MKTQPQGVVLAVHGGAGAIRRELLTPVLLADFAAALAQALRTGWTLSQAGGSSLDVVEAAVGVLEDCPLFNAGRGAVFTHEGCIELDASIMDGKTLQAGAVAGVQGVRNPIQLARRVLSHSDHVLLTGRGAEAFAREQGLAFEPESYFFVQGRWEQLQQALQLSQTRLDHTSEPEKKFGTVGAVAVDRAGNLAAATSTGGMTNKRFGRVGDSPLVGAGVYANNATCAVSSTGHGEYFMRTVAAYDVSARMAYLGMGVQEAAEAVVFRTLQPLGGEGGMIVLDRQGKLAMPYNSRGMYRGYITESGQLEVAVFEESLDVGG